MLILRFPKYNDKNYLDYKFSLKFNGPIKGEIMTKSTNPETIALHGGDYRKDPATTAVAVPV